MTKTTTFLKWNAYRYFPYERVLAQREVSALLKPVELVATEDGLQVTGKFKKAHLKRLVYFGGYRSNGRVISTLQHDLESSCTVTGAQKRQSTRYSVHGLHEYKGKFNPQVVRGVLNILGMPAQSKIIDPFCGSGTSLVECAHVGMTAVGCDMNPLAVYIANAKLKALATPASVLQEIFVKLTYNFERGVNRNIFLAIDRNKERTEYLWSWFDKQILFSVDYLKALILDVAPKYSEVFLALASDLLRDYSLQEPTDLRIRKRYSPFPQQPFGVAFQQKTLQFLNNLESIQKIVRARRSHCRAYLCDSREIDVAPKVPKPAGGYDAVITSPPYATALPYIDTQRLSLVWLDLVTPGEIGDLDACLTGSREFIQKQRKYCGDALSDNRRQLPDNIYKYCLKLQKAVSQEDGFRRKAMPALMYRYLSDMRDVFRGMLKVMRKSAPFALIVGHNGTTLGGHSFDIDTPSLLREVAAQSGWVHEDSIPLQTYQRYGSHMANAVKAETLLIVRKP